MIRAAVDNDILKKAVCYALVGELFGAMPAALNEVAFLQTAKYVIRSRLAKIGLVRAVEDVTKLLDQVIGAANPLEPTPEEVDYAAALEYDAQRLHVELDTGESILTAVVIEREIPILSTGDKRAIRAMEVVLAARSEAARLRARVIALEQLVARLIEAGAGLAVRTAVCAEPHVDRALTLCFSCHSAEVEAGSWAEGVASYVRAIRAEAPTITMET